MLEVARYQAERRTLGAVALAGGLAAFAALFLAVGPSIVAEADLASLIESYPPALQRAFGLEAFGSFVGLLATELYQFGWVLLLGVYFAYLGGGAVASDVESGRAEMLLSTPISRARFVVENYLALAWPMLVVSIVVGGVVAVGAAVVGETVPLDGLLAVHVLGFVYLLAVAALGVCCSAFVDRAAVAQRVAGAAVFGLFLLDSVVGGTDYDALGALAPSRYYDPTAVLVRGEYDLLGAAGLLAAAVVLVGVGVVQFRRRDV